MSMKSAFNSSVLYLLIALTGFFTSCKKDQGPAPQTGTLLAYTDIKKSEFDRIDVIVDGKVAASLTAPFDVKPTCGAKSSPSAVVIPLAPGTYKVYAIQYKDGKNVGEWEEENETITANKCSPFNWTE